jgi:ABC-type nickel/cobalt efflux system permease component RcnA
MIIFACPRRRPFCSTIILALVPTRIVGLAVVVVVVVVVVYFITTATSTTSRRSSRKFSCFVVFFFLFCSLRLERDKKGRARYRAPAAFLILERTGRKKGSTYFSLRLRLTLP